MRKKLLFICITCLMALTINGCSSEKGISEIISNADSLVAVANNIESLDAIVERDTYSVISNIKTEKDNLISSFATYDDYAKNKQQIKEYYSMVLNESEQLSFRLQAYCINYANIIIDTNSPLKEKYKEVEIIKETIYDDAFDEIHDEIYNDIFDELNDYFYNGIIKDARKSVNTDEWFDVRSDAYDLWLDTRSDFYDTWSDARSDIYSFWSDLRSDFYAEELEDAKNTISDFQEDVLKLKWNSSEYILLELAEEQSAAQITSAQILEEGYYVVGDYIKEGKYLFTNTSEDDYCKIAVFENEENYNNYKVSERKTIGEENSAIEQNAYYDINMNEEGDIAYISLKKGNVLMLSQGSGSISNTDLPNLITSGEQLPMNYGFYIIGEDIKEGQYKIICSDADYGTELTLFENIDSYLNYFKSNRYTLGEESDAKKANSIETKYIYEDDSFSAYLKSGNILLLEKGYVTIEQLYIKPEENTEKAISESTKEVVSDNSDNNEWKAFLEDYESWVDDYIEITKKYKENPDDSSILPDYTKMATELLEWQTKSTEIEAKLKEASPTELANYSAELLKISAKIAEASL